MKKLYICMILSLLNLQLQAFDAVEAKSISCVVGRERVDLQRVINSALQVINDVKVIKETTMLYALALANQESAIEDVGNRVHDSVALIASTNKDVNDLKNRVRCLENTVKNSEVVKLEQLLTVLENDVKGIKKTTNSCILALADQERAMEDVNKDVNGLKNVLRSLENTVKNSEVIKLEQRLAVLEQERNVIKQTTKHGIAYLVASEVGIAKRIGDYVKQYVSKNSMIDNFSALVDCVVTDAVVSGITWNKEQKQIFDAKSAQIAARNSTGIMLAALLARKILPKKYTANWSESQKACAFAAAHFACDVMTSV